jgi:glycosyltransferase involved in cell wall biosynthesis
MKFGFLPALAPSSGGVYQYGLALLEAFAQHPDGDRCVVFSRDLRHPTSVALAEQGFAIQPLENAGAPRWRRSLMRRARVAGKRGAGQQHRSEIRTELTQSGVDMMVYPVPDTLSFESGVAYLFAVHDLNHRLQPEFPEVAANGEWERREHLFGGGITGATLVLADSEVGREDIVRLYGRDEGSVKVLPYPPPVTGRAGTDEIRQLKKRFGLPERYLFYPAQFWPHKNHERLVRAFAVAQKQIPGMTIVFTGASEGALRQQTFARLKEIVAELNLGSRVLFLGYVADDDLVTLFSGAHALVMPTFFGPTNIPVLEAWQYECPVLTSDIRGIREQVGDAGVLVDPTSIEAICEGLVTIWGDDALRDELVRRGVERVSQYTFSDFSLRFRAILDEARDRHAARPTDSAVLH